MLIIGIAGGSGSGKTTVVGKIAEQFSKDNVLVISQDSYYKDNGDLSEEEKRSINFDHPDSIEFDLLIHHLKQLKAGKSIEIPIYSYLTCGRAKETIKAEPKDVVIIEGILMLVNEEIRKLLDIKIFVDADSDERLMRIIQRDIVERGRTYQQVLFHYATFVKPMHSAFIEPTRRFADIILPEGGQNHVAIDILCSKVTMQVGKNR